MNPIFTRAIELKSQTTAWRRDFHAHPEIGFKEIRTAGIIANELDRLGFQVSTAVGRTGVVGVLEGRQPGKCILLRFDMDALPIQEETDLQFKSTSPGVMHACGHDGHVAIGLTVATMLKEILPSLAGTIKLVFQPAEEGLGGAAAMIEDGVLKNPEPEVALGMHLWNEFPVGKAAITPGPFMAGADMFRITITGLGGHGAMPQTTRDPIVAGAQIVSALQTVVARNIAPLQSAVISITQFQSGTALNIIPGQAVLGGTVRTYESAVREAVWQRMRSIITGVSSALGCRADIEIFESTPPVVNAEEITRVVQAAAGSIHPALSLLPNYQSSVSEDMAMFLEKIPGCYFFLGSAADSESERFGHHHPRFTFNEEALPLGAAILTQAAVNLLGTGGG